MKGKILDFTIQQGGIIITEDDKRFTFVTTEWKETNLPCKGQLVNFVAHDDGKATGIYEDISAQPITVTSHDKASTTKDLNIFEYGFNIAFREKYATFTGRANRKEYWGLLLIYAIFNLITFLILSSIDNIETATALNTAIIITTIVFGVPQIAVTTRRLHDIGKSGWWQLLDWIPVIGFIPTIIWGIIEGNANENQYGSKP